MFIFYGDGICHSLELIAKVASGILIARPREKKGGLKQGESQGIVEK